MRLRAKSDEPLRACRAQRSIGTAWGTSSLQNSALRMTTEPQEFGDRPRTGDAACHAGCRGRRFVREAAPGSRRVNRFGG